MKQYFIGFNKDNSVRHQPWLSSERDDNEKYYDFRKNPELIREVLEDFVPWSKYKSVQDFYDLIEWLNNPESPFETNDCAFSRSIEENNQRELAPKNLVAIGRLMVFFRNTELNISPESKTAFYRGLKSLNPQVPDFVVNPSLQWLSQFSLKEIQKQYPEAPTCIGLEIYPVYFENAEGENDEKLGNELSFKFWMWGDTEEEVMENFGLVVQTLKHTFSLAIETITKNG